jgi:hypothetical protein
LLLARQNPKGNAKKKTIIANVILSIGGKDTNL